MTKAIKGRTNPWMLGDENVAKRKDVKEKISKALKGRVVTWGDKVSASKKGVPNLKNRKPKTDEQKQKIREGVIRWNKENPELAKKQYAAMTEASLKSEKRLAGYKKASKTKLGHAVSDETKEKMRTSAIIGMQRSDRKYFDTSIELLYEKSTFIDKGFAIDIDYFKQYPLPLEKPICIPDFYDVHTNTAIFIDGCYWHGCDTHGLSNKERKSIKQRDDSITNYLRTCGFNVVRIWEHDIEGSTKYGK